MKRGFTLIELIIYITVLTGVFWMFASIVLSVNRSYADLAARRNLDIAAVTVTEKITRSVRSATSVDSIDSTFGTTPGVLALNETNDSGMNSIYIFQTNGQTMQMKIDGADQGTLLPASVTVTSLIFNLISTPNSQAVKMAMQLQTINGSSTISNKYYSTVVLRGSYK